jgi:hypothetical protein
MVSSGSYAFTKLNDLTTGTQAQAVEFVPAAHDSPWEPYRRYRFYFIDHQEDGVMKLISVAMATALACSSTFALGQSAGAPSGRGSTTGDPAASSATPGSSPTTGSSMKPSPSGSGTSTLGGKDDNGDQDRDKMPGSSQGANNNMPR